MSELTDLFEKIIAQREAVKGMPSEGPYPATIEEVADELFNFIVEIDSTCARGVLVELHEQLYKRIRES